MRSFYKKLVIPFFFLATFLMFAQQPVSVHLTEKDGLPDNEFYNVIEDRKGFIWLASNSGLYRYDGKTYTQYTNPEKRGLSVFELFEDNQGRIWCTNISGQFFYVENNKLITFIDLKKELKGQLATYDIKNNTLFVTTQGLLYLIDLSTKKITRKEISTNSGVPFVSNDADYFTIAFDSVKIFNKKIEKIASFPLQIHSFYKGKQNTGQGYTRVFKINETYFFTQQFKHQNVFRSINFTTKKIELVNGLEQLKDKRIIKTIVVNNNLWVLTRTGIYIYKNDKDQFILKNQILKNETVTQVTKDKDENYWITTLANGIYLIPNIEVVKHTLPDRSNDIVALNKVNDSIVFFGSNAGSVGFLNVNASTNRTSAYLNNRVSAIQYNQEKDYSYVSTDNAVYFVNNNTLKATKSTKVDPLSSVKSIARINKNSMLFGTYSQLFSLNETTNVLEDYYKRNRVYSMHKQLEKNTVFVGFVDDLIVFDSNSTPTIIKYNNKEILANSITETNNGTIWVGTFKNGVFAIKNKEVVAHYLENEGLLSNQIKHIKADENSLWIATAKGLQEFNTETKTFRSLLKTDGVLSYKITGIEVLEDQIVLSSSEGIFSFDKEKVFKTISQPDVYFNSIKINEEPVVLQSAYNVDYDKNSIQFNFNVNGILYNQNKTYQYRLLGYNNDWITTDLNVNTVKYSSLPAGKYTFQVKPKSDIASGENAIESVKLKIKLPFYKRWWFVMVCGLLLASLIVFYYKWRLKREEKIKKTEIKQLFLDNELIVLKLENLRSQMNPHFIFNALNSIQDYIIHNEQKLARKYLVKFSRLIRIYLEHSQKQTVSLQEEIDALQLYLDLEKDRFEDVFAFSISVSEELNTKTLLMPTFLIQPYVENAIKHGLLHKKDNRKLEVIFNSNKEGTKLICTIIDNGIGRKSSEQINERRVKPKSFSSEANRKRVDLLNKSNTQPIHLEIKDNYDAQGNVLGTTVKIEIPIK